MDGAILGGNDGPARLRLPCGAVNLLVEQVCVGREVSAILLVGLLLNAFLGWWWSDPLAALIMVPIIAKEGIDGVRGRACADCCTVMARN